MASLVTYREIQGATCLKTISLDHRTFKLSRNLSLAVFALFVEVLGYSIPYDKSANVIPLPKDWVYFSGVVEYIPQEILALGYTRDTLFVG